MKTIGLLAERSCILWTLECTHGHVTSKSPRTQRIAKAVKTTTVCDDGEIKTTPFAGLRNIEVSSGFWQHENTVLSLLKKKFHDFTNPECPEKYTPHRVYVSLFNWDIKMPNVCSDTNLLFYLLSSIAIFYVDFRKQKNKAVMFIHEIVKDS